MGKRPFFWSAFAILPLIILFLRHGGDFIGYIFGGEFDIVHEGLLRLVTADVHHLENNVFVAQIHIGDSSTSGCMAGHAVIAWHNHIAVKVDLRLLLFLFQRLFLFHCELGRYFFLSVTAIVPTGLSEYP